MNTSKIMQSTVDLSNVVTHERQLDDNKIQIKFQGLKQMD